MYKFKIKVPSELTEEMRKSMEKKLDDALNDMADYIAAESDRILRSEYPDGAFDTGFLANSIVNDKEKLMYKEVGYSASYAPYIEFGTDPHFPPIKPIYDWVWRKKSDLKIKIIDKKTTTLRDGNTYNIQILRVAIAICKKMEKYGTEEHPFLRPAFFAGIAKIEEFLKK